MATPVARERSRGVRVSGPGTGRVAATLTTAIALATVAGAVLEAGESPFLQGLPTWIAALGASAGLLLVIASWVVGDARPPVAVALAIAAAGLLVPIWAGWPSLPDVVQAATMAVGPIAIVGAVGVGLGWVHGSQRIPVGRAVLMLALLSVLVRLLGYDPFADPACSRTCVHVAVPLAGLITTRTAFVLAMALEVAASLVAASELAQGATAGRARLVSAASLVTVLLLPLADVGHVLAWTDVPSIGLAVVPAAIAGLLLGGAPLVVTAGARRVRRETRDLVEVLSKGALTGRLGHGVVRGVEFAVPSDERGSRWVDPSGSEVAAEQGGRQYAVISDATGMAIRLELRSATDLETVLATITPATLLALRNARLAALHALRLTDVQASQRRIVAASDAARQRIERDLHDGAQQRLVSVSLQLGIASHRLAPGGEAAAHVARAGDHVRVALGRLRQLGRGIFPAALTSEGLAAALEDLARASEVDVTIDVPPLDLERDVALAAYSVVDAALAEARAAGSGASVVVVGSVHGGELVVRVEARGVTDPGPAGLAQAADRVGAVDGRLTIQSGPGGEVVIVAVLPCV